MKTKSKTVGRILTLLLAVVMVFTNMNFGTGMGAELAWADEVQQISSAEDFAKMTPNGSYQLAADITVTEPYASDFSGTFDGNGHTVTLAIDQSDNKNVGLFSNLAAGGEIKNLAVTGSVRGNESVAGIAAVNAGTISNCKNEASVSAEARYAGGIAGKNNGTIQNSYNLGTVRSARTRSGANIGGIAGYMDNVASSVQNCYNTGQIVYEATTSNVGAILGWISNGSVNNCFYLKAESLNGTNESSSGNPMDRATGKTSADMQTEDFVKLLGDAFMYKAGDYPALSWETPTTSVAFAISPSNAVLNINGAKYTGSCNIALPAGTHAYTVSLDGYAEQSGTVTVSEGSDGTLSAEPESVNVELQEDASLWDKVNFVTTPSDAVVTIKDGDNVLSPEKDGSYKVLKAKTYTYAVTAEGYEDEAGTYSFDADGNTKTVKLLKVESISLSGDYKTEYVQGDKFDSTGLVVTVHYDDNSEKTITEGYTAAGFDSSAPADNQTITISYKGKTATYTVKIEEKLFPSSVFNGLKGKAAVEYTHNSSYKGEAGKEFIDDKDEGALKSNSAGMGSSQVTVRIKLNDNLGASKLYFDYKVSAETSYGSNAYDGIQINGGSKIGNTEGFVSHALTVKGGDVVTLAYTKDYRGDGGSDCMWLKNFRLVELHNIEIETPGVTGAAIVLKDAAGKEVQAEAGKYAVEDGTYTYTITAFGYEEAKGEIEVKGADVKKAVTLNKLSTQKVTFSINVPEGLNKEDASVVVKSGTTAVKAEADGSYLLPAGEYAYTITHPNCDDVTGSFNVEAAEVAIPIAMTRKLVFADIFAGLDGIEAKNKADIDKTTVYGFDAQRLEDEAVLASNNNGAGNSAAAMKITAKTPQKVSFLYKIGTEKNYDWFYIYSNGKEVVKKSGEENWTNYNAKLKTGDSIVVKYTKDGYGDKNGDTVYLKNFTAAGIQKVTFTGVPEAAKAVIKQGNNIVNPEADGTYLLEAGDYTYIISGFGYETITKDFTVASEDMSIPISMNVLAKQTVTFHVTKPENISSEAAVQVNYKDSTVAAEADGTYKLPAGTYSYTVTCSGCETENGTFEVASEDKEITVNLEKTLTFEDFFTELDGRANVANHTGNYKFKPVKDGSVKYLQSSNTTSDTENTITITFDKPTKLSFDYMVSESGSEYSGSNYGLRISRNGKLIDRYEEISDDWKTYSVSAAKADKITLTYKCYKNNNSMTETDENWVRLKNFKAVPLTQINFAGVTENAKISIAQENTAVSPVDGKFLLAAGAYTYTVEAFGYEKIANESFAVDGSKDSDTITVSMTQTARTDVKFEVTPAEAQKTIIVKNADGEVMSAEADDSNHYRLPKGESYSYEITASGYITANGYFDTSDARTIRVSLDNAGAAWDGVTRTEPGKSDDVYQISNAEELAWFAAQVNDGKANYKAKLIENINLNNKEWTSIGTNSKPFNGEFDGSWKTISGLKGSNGLFDTVESSGNIKNLILDVDIAGSGNIGGAVGTLKGKIENVTVSGNVSNSQSMAGCGGIVGRIQDNGSVTGAVNKAKVTSTYAYYAGTLNLGGIVGYTYGKVENCYNVGAVSAREDRNNTAIGGIAGAVKSSTTLGTVGTVVNSYNAGAVTGPSAGIGAAVGTNEGTITNTYYLQGTATNKIAASTPASATDVQEKTADEMKTDVFAFTLGDAFNKDTDNLNNGFPVLKWQGGSVPSVPQYEQDAESDLKAIGMKDLDRARELEEEKQNVDALVEAEGGLDALKQLYEDDTLTMEYLYQLYDIDLDDDGTLRPDTDNKYQVKKTMHLELPASGANGSTIAWTSSNKDIINPANGKITLPAEGKAEVTLTVNVTKGRYTKTKAFSFVVWSEGNQNADLLAEIKAKAEQTSTFIQPLQVYGQTNITQAMQQWIARQDYPVDGIDKEGVKVTFLDAGTQTMPHNDTAYIGTDGTLTYFTGTEYGYGTKYAIYNDVKFKLEYEGEETEINVRAHIGWDTAYVENLLDKAMEKVTWDTIKGNNTNTAEEREENGWMRTIVNGDVTGDLTLPISLEKISYATIKWTADDMKALYVTDNGDGTYNATLERPAKGEEANKFTLKGIATFNFWDDYTLEEMTSMNGKTDPAESFKLFDLRVPANDEDQSEQISDALAKYPDLLRDFVNKDKKVDPAAIDSDLQMPRPSTLEDEGIMPDRYNQKVTMTSSNTDVLNFYGYHAEVYRPLPGEDPVDVEYTIRILDRRNNALLGEKTFKLTVKPLTQSEIDEAAAWMKKICTEEVYWNGIKGENTAKDNITGNLESFAEILKGENGEPVYNRGAGNITFGGIEVDDLPGYDSMGTQPWREFRSSKHSVIACETLLLTQPEYNTNVKIDSVLTDSVFGKYWEKFSDDPRYAQFEQFYKQPVATSLVVKGTTGIDNPNPTPSTIKATISVDGKGNQGFKNLTSTTLTGLDADTTTVWDVVRTALKDAGYTYSGMGDYVASITDPNGVTLTDTDTANSGWLYTVNGKMPNVYMGSYYLNDNDVINLYYTADYTKDPNAGSWSEPAKEVVTTGSAGSVVTTSPTAVKVSEKTNADGTKEKVAEVTVSADNQKEILKQAKENKSTEIVLNVAKDSVKDAAKADIKLDKSFIDSIVKDTNAKLTIKTPFGDKTYTQDELKALSEAATGSTVTIAVEKTAEEPTDDDAVKAEKIAKAKKLTASMKLTARSAKTAKKNVKVTVKTNSKTTASIKELKDLGYTVKYRYYRSAKKAASYKSAVTKSTKTYINTAGTKGKMYYYKAQVRVYDENGKLITKTALKQCKYANRQWAK